MKVWVTRDEPAGGPLESALRHVGLVPVREPVIERRVDEGALDALPRLGPDDWLVLTSIFAIQAMPDRARTPRVAVVGEASRLAAEARGLRVELVGDEGAKALFRKLAPRAGGATVLYPRSSLARVPELPGDVALVSPVLYETVPRAFRREVVDEIDVVTVASPSAVRAIGRVDRPYASIGPTTTGALAEIGLEPWLEAPRPTFPDLAAAIAARA
jgi:uroporphyrinogen-III synthase